MKIFKVFKWLLLTLFTVSLITFLFMQQKSFGKLPSGKRLERIKQSKNYHEGNFKNIEETPVMAEGVSYFTIIKEYFSKGVNREPSDSVPGINTDLKSLSSLKPTIVWFGHSSYLILINGYTILVDPVLSDRASPVSYLGVAKYKSKVNYSISDFPAIDAVIITHDHYDHLDYKTILQLKDTARRFYTSLGVGSHLAYWGVDESKIQELDWWENVSLKEDLELTATPARHFSGRGFKRNKTLWSSFVLKSNDCKIFIGGDSGYDNSFKVIGNKFGPFDLAIVECGQYDLKWPYIHMQPEQTVQASVDLQAKVLLPVHWGKFTLALHPWSEPIERAIKHAESLQVTLATPLIGQPLDIKNPAPVKPWWSF